MDINDSCLASEYFVLYEMSYGKRFSPQVLLQVAIDIN